MHNRAEHEVLSESSAIERLKMNVSASSPFEALSELEAIPNLAAAGAGGSALLPSAGGEAIATGEVSVAPAHVPALEFPADAFSLGRVYCCWQRVLDVVISVVALSIFGLMLPVLALLIKIDSPGSVFYTQERIGMNRRRERRSQDSDERRKVLRPGRPFRILKLRTMTVDAEAGGPTWAKKDDVRITAVGKILRKTRLDEVPQFVNVLKGEMSLIGPRPERLCFIRQLEKQVPHYHERLLVQPGITGLAQVLNGYDSDTDSVRRKVELDRSYIRSKGILQDLWILALTARVVIKGEGAN